MKFLPALTLTLALTLTAAAQQGKHLTLPDIPDEGINRGQSFDRNVPDASVYGGRVYFVWGANKPSGPPPALYSKYLPYSRDYNRKNTLEWYKQNHPDWIVYTADHKTPAWGFTYPTGNSMSLDITNPAVREFYFNTYIEPAIAEGYTAFAFDNVQLTNWDKRSGHFDAQGKWVQQFSGEKVDSAYVLTVLQWMQYLTTRLHERNIAVAANLKFPLGMPELVPAFGKLVDMVDIWGDEQGFTQHNDNNVTDARWVQKFDFIRSLPPGKYHWAVNETTKSRLADSSPQQIDYAIANYYLYREKNSMLSVCGAQEYGGYVDDPALHVDLGSPLAAPVHDAGGAWTRAYSRGMVAVNPQLAVGAEVKLPKGNWMDSRGGHHAGKLLLGPNSGYMLLRP